MDIAKIIDDAVDNIERKIGNAGISINLDAEKAALRQAAGDARRGAPAVAPAPLGQRDASV
jgi:replication-associated recombination protein RarA